MRCMKGKWIFAVVLFFVFAACKKEGQKEQKGGVATKKEAVKKAVKKEEKKVKNFKFPVAGDPDSALVRVYILSDFQCPVCKRAAKGIKELIPELTKQKVAFVYVPYPLKMHRKAMGAAIAAMAAFKQGKFWEFHDKLFENQYSLGNDFYLKVAQELKLDLEKFKKDLQSPEIKKSIEEGLKIIEKLGARGTPSFLINGKLQIGWGSAAGLKSSILNEKKQVEKLLSQGKSVSQAYMERFKGFISKRVPQNNDDIVNFFNNLSK